MDLLKFGIMRLVIGFYNLMELGYLKENWFFNFNFLLGLLRYVIFLDVMYGCILSYYGEGFLVIW